MPTELFHVPDDIPQRIMSYIDAGKADGAKVHLGGEQFGTDTNFIKPTIFTETTPDMKIVKEEIFGPVCVVVKFEDEDGKTPEL